MKFSVKLLNLLPIFDIFAYIVNLFVGVVSPVKPFCHSEAKAVKQQTTAESETMEKDIGTDGSDDSSSYSTDGDNQSSERFANNANNGTSYYAKNTKCTMTGDNDDKDDRNRSNNCYDGCKHNIPIVTNYYCYDQRVYK